jgi:hypothetical protein
MIFLSRLMQDVNGLVTQGFKGDRNWDKGFSAPNEEITSLPTTPVKLLGRLPTTHPIMSAPLASHVWLFLFCLSFMY